MTVTQDVQIGSNPIYPAIYYMKKCYKCNTDKEPDDFYKNKCKKDGLQTICKECSNKRRTKYYLEHREKEQRNRKENKQKITKWFKDYKSKLKCEESGGRTSFFVC